MADAPVLLDEGLFVWLTQPTGPLASVLSQANVFMGYVPESAPMPCLKFQQMTDKSDTTFDGPSGFDERTYQFNFYGRDVNALIPNAGYVMAVKLRDLARKQMNGLTGYFPNGIRLFNTILSAGFVHYDEDSQLYTAIDDYRIQFLQI